MKKLISIILASFVAFAAFAAEKSIPAVMLQDDGYLFIEEDGQMNYKMSIPAGSELEVLTVKNENGVVVPELKESKRLIDKKLVACKCYHVKYNNKPYWCLTDRIGLNEKIGIIIADCAVYRSPDVCDIKEKTALTVGTVVSSGESYTANGKFKLVKITYYDPKNYEVYSGYIKQDKLSSQKDDYKGIKIIKSIKKILKDEKNADKGLLEENYKNFKNLTTSPSIRALCDEIMNPKVEEPEEEIDDETAMFRELDVDEWYAAFNVYCPADGSTKINIRSLPSTENSKVVGQFKWEGELDYCYTVSSSYRTIEPVTVDGLTDYWYYVTTDFDVKGWVFGGFLTLIE